MSIGIDLWADVRVDPAATDTLVRELVATARALGEVAEVLAGDGLLIAEDWGGPHRDAFDVDRDGLVASIAALAERLLWAAADAAELLASGQGDQRLRVRLRHQALAAEACAPGRPC